MAKNTHLIKEDVVSLAILVVPLALIGLVQASVWFFQTLFLAHVSQQAIAAGGLVSWFFSILLVIVSGTLSSIGILVSHRSGAKDEEGIATIARDGIRLAVLMAVPAIILLRHATPLFAVFGQSDDVIALAKPYLNAISWGLMADFISRACISVIVASGRARIALMFSMITIFTNVISSYLLIFGKFGMPKLGIAGAGWGMSVSYLVTFVMLMIYISKNIKIKKYFRYVFQPCLPIHIKELFYLGFPMGMMHCVEVAFFFTLTVAMGAMSAETQAANQITLQYLNVMMAMMFSLAQAVTIRMGHLFGAKDYSAAERSCNIGVLLALIFISFISAFYLLAPQTLIAFDIDVSNPVNFGIIAQTEKFLMLAAIFQLFEAMRIAMIGAMRSLKETKFTLFTSTISFWCIAIPLGYFLAHDMRLGSAGFWWAMILGAVIGLILLRRRFWQQFKQSQIDELVMIHEEK